MVGSKRVADASLSYGLISLSGVEGWRCFVSLNSELDVHHHESVYLNVD